MTVERPFRQNDEPGETVPLGSFDFADTVRPGRDPRAALLRHGAALLTGSLIETSGDEVRGAEAVSGHLYNVIAHTEGSFPPAERAAVVRLLVVEQRTRVRQDLVTRGGSMLRSFARRNDNLWVGMERNFTKAQAAVLNGNLDPLTQYGEAFAKWHTTQKEKTTAYLVALDLVKAEDKKLALAEKFISPADEDGPIVLTEHVGEATRMAVADRLVARIAQAQADSLDPGLAVALLVAQDLDPVLHNELKVQAAFIRRYVRVTNSSALKIEADVERIVGAQTPGSTARDLFSEDERQAINTLTLARSRIAVARRMVSQFLKPAKGSSQAAVSLK